MPSHRAPLHLLGRVEPGMRFQVTFFRGAGPSSTYTLPHIFRMAEDEVLMPLGRGQRETLLAAENYGYWSTDAATVQIFTAGPEWDADRFIQDVGHVLTAVKILGR